MNLDGQQTWEETPRSLRFAYQVGLSLRVMIVCQMIIAFSTSITMPLLVLDSARSATRVDLECERALGMCSTTPRWAHLPRLQFPLSALKDPRVEMSGKTAELFGGPNREVSLSLFGTYDPIKIEALTQAADRLRAFVASSEPRLRLTFPVGDRPHVFGFALAAFLFGLLSLRFLLNSFTSSEITIERDTQRATQRRHWLFFAATRTAALGDFKAIQLRHRTIVAFGVFRTVEVWIQWTRGAWPIFLAYLGQGGEQAVAAEERLARFFANAAPGNGPSEERPPQSGG